MMYLTGICEGADHPSYMRGGDVMIVIRNLENGQLREALNEFDEFFLGYESSVPGLVSGMYPVVVYLKSRWMRIIEGKPEQTGKLLRQLKGQKE